MKRHALMSVVPALVLALACSGSGASGGANSGGANSGGANSGGANSGGATIVGGTSAGVSSSGSAAGGASAAGSSGQGSGGSSKGGAAGSFPGAVGHWTAIDTASGDTLPDAVPVKLKDGSVLLIGGFGASTVYRFIPADNSLKAINQLPEPRGNFAASVLEDGRILIAGGNSPDVRDGMTTCLLYDPTQDKWTPTAPLPAPRALEASIRLPDGDVLVVGGVGPGVGGVPTGDVYRYSVAGGQWQTLGALTQPARFHRLFLLGTETLLVVAENPQLYDLTTQTVTSSPALTQSRRYAKAVQLADGGVLAIGGSPFSMTETDKPFAVVDEYVAGSSGWSKQAALSSPRYDAGAVTLRDGTVMVAGGVASFVFDENDPSQQSAERYVPATDRWYPEAAPPLRTGGSAVLLDDGSVLFVNGLLARFYPEAWQ